MKAYSLEDRIYGSLLTASVGDALGAPTEGFSRQEIISAFGRIRQFEDPSLNVISPDNRVGEITDDSSQMIEMIKMIIQTEGKLTIQDAAQALLNWSRNWPKYYPRNAGNTTKYVITSLGNGDDPVKVGQLGKLPFRGATNGAIMRIAPAGLIHPKDLDGACETAVVTAIPSHGTQHAFSGACAIACAIAEALDENASVWSVLKAAMYGAKKGQAYGEAHGRVAQGPNVSYKIEQAVEVALRCASVDEAECELQNVIGCDNYSAQTTVAIVLGMFAAADGDTMRTLEGCANVGGDTDTFACVAGMIAGAFNGPDAVPQSLREGFDAANPDVAYKQYAAELSRLAQRA